MTDWNRRACRWEDPELFFPIGTLGPALRQAEQAKAICRRCPIRTECLNFAIDTGSKAGIFGGFDEEERESVRRRIQRTQRTRRTAEPAPEGEKRCSRCRTTKAFAEFDRNRRNRDGHADACKTCRDRLYERRRDRVVTMPDAKRCTRCELTKPAAEFARAKAHSTGLTSDCKECRNRANRERVIAKRKVAV